MEGVTILATNEAVEATGFSWVVAIIVFLAAIFINLMYGLLNDSPGIGLIVGVILGFSLGILAGFTAGRVSSPETYKVTISDTVNFNEFNERYKIINQEGLIYIVTERNLDENP